MAPVSLDVGRLQDYDGFVEPSLRTRVALAAERLRGRRVVHDNATSFWRGVAEVLRCLEPVTSDRPRLLADYLLLFEETPGLPTRGEEVVQKWAAQVRSEQSS
ncbi:MAG: hypothetical protein A2Y74_02445 [Actinobacteria bacterium RBG_13_63_9]|nr:MAG: hypothetical protein A2Y74_02445 [Actinobacteria bacterium RBG_13_63_9]